MRKIAVVAVLVLVLVACGEAQPVSTESPTDTEVTSTSVVAESEPEGATTTTPPPTTTLQTLVTTTTVAKPAPSPTSDTTMPPPSSVDPDLQPLIDLAVADLAERLGVEPNAIAVAGAESVTWPDASAGCPQPGMAYRQVPVDGALIVLSVDGVEYRYHSGGARPDPFLCETGQE